LAEILGGIVDKARASITSGVDLLLVVAGAGASSAIAEVVKSWLPEQTATIADETLVIAVGFLLFYFGDRIHPKLVPFGFGMFISGVGAWSSAWIAGLITMLKKGGATA